MGMTRAQVRDFVRKRLGAPLVKVEIDDSQIDQEIVYARNKFIKWAVGQATQEIWFTIMLEAGKTLYDLPIGVTNVVSYVDGLGNMSGGGINTLFTMENYLYNNGAFDALLSTKGSGYGVVDYHLAKDFVETFSRYFSSQYFFKYHKFTNQIEVSPTPPEGNSLVLEVNGQEVIVDSPGFILIHGYAIEGSTIPNADVFGEMQKEIKREVETRQLKVNEIEAGYLTLAYTPLNREDVSFIVDGVDQVPNLDFKVNSSNQLVWKGFPIDGILSANDTAIVTYDRYSVSGGMFPTTWEEDLFENDWFLDYITARSKYTLGIVRRKFSSFSSLGNQGISLDGDTLVSEAQQEIEQLEEKLRNEESWEGYGIIIG
jgi:hypothetical protein